MGKNEDPGSGINIRNTICTRCIQEQIEKNKKRLSAFLDVQYTNATAGGTTPLLFSFLG
jgi:hypothetical protein